MKTVICLLATIITPLSLQAEDEKNALATKLYGIINTEDLKESAKSNDAAYKAYVSHTVSQFRTLYPEAPDGFFDEYEELMLKHFLSSQRKSTHKQRYIEFSSEQFDESELKALIDFYESALGQKVLKNRAEWTRQNSEYMEKAFREWYEKNSKLLVEEYRLLLEKYVAEFDRLEQSGVEQNSDDQSPNRSGDDE
ncbi:MAG: DUF2059 domain-containing protein [Verrucomicrobiota bacterium]